MGLEQVKEQIIAEARKKAESIVADAKKQAQEISRQTAAEIKRFKKDSDIKSQKMLEMLERKEVSAANFECQRNMLDVKRDLINESFESAEKKLAKLSTAQRKKILNSLLEKAKKEIELSSVYVNKDDTAFLKEKGIKAKEKKMLGGLIAETKDGKVMVDYSFEELLDIIKEEHLQEISKALFK